MCYNVFKGCMMNRAQSAIIPGFLLGSLIVVLIGTWATANLVLPAELLQPLASAPQTQSGDGLTNLLAGLFPEAKSAPESKSITDSASVEQKGQIQSTTGGDCQVSASFPDTIRQWCNLIMQYSSENSLDPNLTAAVILQESGGDPTAYSHSGAVGLMQVMPRDGIAANFTCQNGPCFASRPTIDELQNPEFNISYGTKMLSGLINKYGNSRDGLRYYGPADVGYYYADIVLAIYKNYQ